VGLPFRRPTFRHRQFGWFPLKAIGVGCAGSTPFVLNAFMPSIQTLKQFSAIALGIFVALLLYIFTAYPSYAYDFVDQSVYNTSGQQIHTGKIEQRYPTTKFENFGTSTDLITHFSVLVRNTGGSTCTDATITATSAAKQFFCDQDACSTTANEVATLVTTALNVPAGGTQWIEWVVTTPKQLNRLYIIDTGVLNSTGASNCTNTYWAYQNSSVISPSEYTSGTDAAFRLSGATPDPRESPVITIQTPDDVTYLSTDVPLRWVTDVCEDDYSDEEPLWAATLSLWDGDSYETYETRSFADSHNLLVDNGCTTGLAYGFGEISPALFWPAALPDGDYELEVSVQFDGFSASDSVTQQFTVGELTIPTPPSPLDDLDVLAVLDFPSASCSFVDDSVGEAIVTVATCFMDTIVWAILGPSDPVGVFDEITGIFVSWFESNEPQLFLVNYAAEPVASMYSGYASAIGDACDLPVLDFVDHEVDLCDVLSPVRDQSVILNIMLNAAFWLAMVSMMIGIFFTAFGQSYDGD